MKKNIIFDVDGTLWDSTSSIAQSYNETIKQMGVKSVPITTEIIRGFMGYVREEIANIVFPEYPLEQQLAYIDKCMEEECNYLVHHPGVLYADVEDVLNVLSHTYDLYIVSNCQDGYIESLFAAYDIQKFFKDYECSGRTGMKKGDNIKFLMKRNHIENAIYVGDTIKDKQASDEVCIPFIYASYGFGEVKEYRPSIGKFNELLELL